MGMILDSTPAMGGWGVEVRSESFYLHDPEPEYTDDGRRNPAMKFGVLPDGFNVAASEIPHIIAALDQVHRWIDKNGTTNRPGSVRMQDVQRGDGLVFILGDIGAASLEYLHEQDYDRTGALEITYAELLNLKRGLSRVQLQSD